MARDSFLFSPKDRPSTISRVETVLSFNCDGENSINDDVVLDKIPTEASYSKLKKELKDLQQQLNEVRQFLF